MRIAPSRAFVVGLTFAVAACGEQSRPTAPVDRATPDITTSTVYACATKADEKRVRDLIALLYPGNANKQTRDALIKKFDEGLDKLQEGKQADAFKKFTDLMKVVDAGFDAGELADPPGDLTTADAVAELFARLFVCAGYDQPDIPTDNDDIIVGVVDDPSQPYTFTSTEGDYGVQTPAGFFSQPVVIVGSKLPNDDDVQDTYSEHPIKTLITAQPPGMEVAGLKVIVKLCAFEPSPPYAHLADVSNIRILQRHDNGTSELLPPSAGGPVLDCQDNLVAGINPSGSSANVFASIGRALRGARSFAARVFGPAELSAAAMVDGGVGGEADDFSSIFVGVDQRFSDDFEEASGWTATGFWHRSTLKRDGNPIVNQAFTDDLVDLATGDGSAGALPNPFLGNWVFWYGTEVGVVGSEDGNYIGTRAADQTLGGGTSTAANSGVLTSPVFVVPANAVLRFNTWFEIESVDAHAFDLMTVRVKEVGTGGLDVAGVLNPTSDPCPVGICARTPFTSAGFDTPPTWFESQVDLGAFSGKTVQLTFEFGTQDVLYNGFRGWLLDNVRVEVNEPPVLARASAALSTSGTRALNPTPTLRSRNP